MLYRAAMVVVVLFWAAMWTLLIRSELRPQETALRTVRPELVLRQVFQQAQPSDLSIKSGASRTGHLRLSPKIDEQTGVQTLDFLGNTDVDLPGAPGQRAYWSGTIEMSPDFELRHLRSNFSLRPPGPHAPTTTSLQVEIDPAQKMGRYRLVVGEDDPVEENFTLDQAGLNLLLQRWGIDPRLTRTLSPGGLNVSPEVTARLSRLPAGKEQVETFLLTVKNQGQTLLEIHLSQLGQVLHVKTLLGWELSPE